MTAVRPTLVGSGLISQHSWWYNERIAAVWGWGVETVHFRFIFTDFSPQGTQGTQCITVLLGLLSACESPRYLPELRVLTWQVWVEPGILCFWQALRWCLWGPGTTLWVPGLYRCHLPVVGSIWPTIHRRGNFIHLKTVLWSYFKISLE